MQKIILNKKIKKIINQLTKKEYKLFKEKLNFKYPGGMGFKPHIDVYFERQKIKLEKVGENIQVIFKCCNSFRERNMKNGCLEIYHLQTQKNLAQTSNKLLKKYSIYTKY